MSGYNNTSKIRKILVNEVYIGRISFGDVYVKKAHEAIISEEIFKKVHAIIEHKKEIYGKRSLQSRHLAVGLLYCGNCGARYGMSTAYYKNKKKTYYYYMCYSRSKRMYSMIKDPTCKNKNWRMEKLDSLIKARVRELLMSPKIVQELIASKSDEPVAVNQDMQKIENRIREIDKQIGKLMDLYQVDGIPANVLGDKINALYHEKTTLEEILMSQKEETQSKSFDLFKELIADAAQIWDFSDDAQKRRIIQGLIRRIILKGDDVDIEWAI